MLSLYHFYILLIFIFKLSVIPTVRRTGGVFPTCVLQSVDLKVSVETYAPFVLTLLKAISVSVVVNAFPYTLQLYNVENGRNFYNFIVEKYY